MVPLIHIHAQYVIWIERVVSVALSIYVQCKKALQCKNAELSFLFVCIAAACDLLDLFISTVDLW